jgi:hypothetical protein
VTPRMHHPSILFSASKNEDDTSLLTGDRPIITKDKYKIFAPPSIVVVVVNTIYSIIYKAWTRDLEIYLHLHTLFEERRLLAIKLMI